MIKKTEKGFKSILVTVPRQVGKSTILKHLYEDRRYITFDNPVLLAETKKEPGLFFAITDLPSSWMKYSLLPNSSPISKWNATNLTQKDSFFSPVHSNTI
jgi:Predicted ATPase (AAA+ superfamily)